ncbi:MAG TPA: hypothetical protein VE621_14035 [Bryobacteraceae bacterium]|nr:hypothetical protein [Bryobacteraceae bacterium]
MVYATQHDDAADPVLPLQLIQNLAGTLLEVLFKLSLGVVTRLNRAVVLVR